MKTFFEGQGLHAAALTVLVAGLAWAWEPLGAPRWYWTAAALAVAHQVFVWVVWRLELHGRRVTRALGARGFTLYAATFAGLGLARTVAVFALAAANPGDLPGDETPWRILAALVLVPALYLFYSVTRYFGYRRALGIDHFDPAYRSRPFERRGIFRFTSNGMYVYGFFLFWVPGLWFTSPAALVLALFNHLYIWVHYFATERPDIRRIYGAR